MKTIGSDTIQTSTVHAFEVRGLGQAPYTFLRVEVMSGPITLKDGSQVGSPGQPMGTCQFCSTGIKYAFWLRSADAKEFYVGCDCIRKAGDKGLLKVVSVFEKKQRQEANEKKRQARWAKLAADRNSDHDRCYELLASSEVKAVLSQKPHPCIASMNLFNYVEFLVDRAHSYKRALGIIDSEMKAVQS